MFGAAVNAELRVLFRQAMRRPLAQLSLLFALTGGLVLAAASQSVLRTVLLRPSGVPNSHQLHQISVREPSGGANRWLPSESAERFLRSAPEGLALGSFREFSAGISLPTGSRVVQGHAVSSGYFSTLGLAASVGRPLDQSDFSQASDPAIVVSHHLWITAFRGDPRAVGQRIRIRGKTGTVVGVLPVHFRGLSPSVLAPIDLWMSLPHAEVIDAFDRTGRTVQAIARDTRPVDVVERQLDTLWRASTAQSGSRLTLRPATTVAFSPSTDILLIRGVRIAQLMIALLLLASGIAFWSDLLGSLASRLHSLQIRAALGAPAVVSILAMCGPHVLIILCATALATLTSRAGGTMLLGWVTRAVPTTGVETPELSSGWTDVMIVWTIGLCLCLVAIILPTFVMYRRLTQKKRLDPSHTGSRRRWPVGLLSVQVALCILLGFIALLGRRMVLETATGDHGYVPASTSFVTIDFGAEGLSPQAGHLVADEVAASLRAQYGNDNVVIADWPSLGYGMEVGGLREVGSKTGRMFIARIQRFGVGTAQAVGLTATAGRLLEPGDFEGTRTVALVDSATARRLSPTGEIIGQPIVLELGGPTGQTVATEHTVVGVFKQLRDQPADMRDHSRVILPLASSSPSARYVSFHVKSSAIGARGVHGISNIVSSKSPDVPIVAALPLHEYSGRSSAPAEAAAHISGTAAGLILIVAMTMVAAGLRRRLNDRSREMAIKTALGASNQRIMRELGASEAAMYGSGIAGGLTLGSVALLMAQRLMPIQAFDGATLLGSLVIVVGAAGAIAAWAPLRAARSIRTSLLRAPD